MVRFWFVVLMLAVLLALGTAEAFYSESIEPKLFLLQMSLAIGFGSAALIILRDVLFDTERAEENEEQAELDRAA